MLLKIGDPIKIKSLNWYKNNINYKGGIIIFPNTKVVFANEMQRFCGCDAVITDYVYSNSNNGKIKGYKIAIDNNQYTWTNEMINSIKIVRFKKLEKIRKKYGENESREVL